MYYKQILENKIVSIGSTNAKSLPNGFEEITVTEYIGIKAELMLNAPQEEETTGEISEYENGFEEGYMQALLDLMELESGEE